MDGVSLAFLLCSPGMSCHPVIHVIIILPCLTGEGAGSEMIPFRCGSAGIAHGVVSWPSGVMIPGPGSP